jgi:uncharacterized protein (UPF0128 family)
MAAKRMTSNDYAKELHKLKLDKIALEKRIKVRAIELCKQNPDVLIQLPYFLLPHKASELEITENTCFVLNNTEDIYSVLKIIEIIEKYLAEQHPHKQTEIEFPKTQHEKLMDIAKNVQAVGINIEKIKDANTPKSKK